MGFIKNMLNKSLFTDDSYIGAIGKGNVEIFHPGYAVITIKPSIPRSFTDKDIEPIVIGIMKENVSLKYEATWSEMGDLASVAKSIPIIGRSFDYVDDAFKYAGNISNLMGGANLGAVYSSKLIYHKSGRLTIDPSFRVVDWKGNSDPLKAAFLIASYCTPFEGKDNIIDIIINWLEERIENGEDEDELLSNLKKLFINLGGLTEDFVRWGVENFKNLLGQAGTNLINNLKEEIKSDFFSVRSSPVPLEVTIGQYFKHSDMVLTNADISFSKEMTKYGPLYVDISLSLTSRKIIGDVKDIGFERKTSSRLLVSANETKTAGKFQEINNFATIK